MSAIQQGRGQVVGYARVSAADQNFDRQIAVLGDTDRLFTDTVSGGSTRRPGLEAMLSYVRDGDTVVVSSMDRLARSLRDLLDLVDELTSIGVAVLFQREAQTYRPGGADPDDPATRAEPPPRRGGADEERGGDRFAAPVREADADERTGAGPRTRTVATTSRATTPPGATWPRTTGTATSLARANRDAQGRRRTIHRPVPLVCYAPFALLRPFTLHCTRKRGVAEGRGA